MIGRLHMNGCPIASTQRELIPIQRVFLEAVTVEILNEEREFQVRLHGGKTDYKPNTGNSPEPKNPDELRLSSEEIRERLRNR